MVDLSFLEKFTKGNPDKMKRYISMYLDSTPKLFEDMEKYLKNKDWEQLRISAHSLKPQAELIGIPSLKNSLIEIENEIKQQSFNSLNTIYSKAYNIHIASQGILKKRIDKL